MEDIALFGAGRELQKYIDLLGTLGIQPLCIADNSPDKWGERTGGIKVVTPEDLRDMECKIMISCAFVNEITEQLDSMGLGKRLIDYQTLFRQSVEDYAEKNQFGRTKAQFNKKESVLIDAFDGIGWGGIEIWSYQVGAGLKNRGYNVTIYGSDWQERQCAETEEMITRFVLQRDDFWDTVNQLLPDMEKKLPFVLVNNWTEHAFVAAYLLKTKNPREVRIVSVIHNDWDVLYRKQAVWKDCFERFAGVSRSIASNLVSKCEIDNNRVCYKENFVKLPGMSYKKNVCEGGSIRISWGARLEILQKRADLLPEFIDYLENEGIDYIFEIAGDGPCMELLESYVAKYELEHRVHILGSLKPEEMPLFWQAQDIYINLSEFEGASLAMLEAMSYGVVPVVTNVSGANEFITNGENGYLVPIGSIGQVASCIESLSKDIMTRKRFSENCMKIVHEKCGINEYLDYIEKDLLFSK